MKDILRSVSKLSIPTGLNILSSIIKNKILALVTGPIGLGIYSQFANLSSLTSAILPIGSLGLVSYISKYYEDEKFDEISSIIKYFLKRNLSITLLITFSFLIFHNQIAYILFASNQFSFLITIFAFSISFSLILNFIDIYFRGIRKIDHYVFFLSVNSLISTIITIFLVFFWGISGAVISLVLSVIINMVFGYFLLKRNKLLPKTNSNSVVQKSVISNIYMLGLGGLVTLVAQQITMLAIKSTIASRLGLGSVGEFQCIYSISSSCFGVFFSLIGTYSMPKVSALKNTIEIIRELNKTVKFLIIVFTPIVVSMFILRSLVISILYSNDFLGVKELLLFQLPAEFVRALSWVTGLWLIPSFKIKQWIIFDSLFYLLFYSIFYVLIAYFNLGVKAASISYLISYVLLFHMYFLYSIRSIDFKFDKYNLKLLLTSLLFLLIGFTISFINELFGYYLVVPILLGWILIVVRKDDFKKIKKTLKLNKFFNIEKREK